MKKIKKISKLILAVTIIAGMCINVNVLAATPQAHSYSFENVTNGAVSSNPTNWSIDVRGNTKGAYTLNYENGLGGKSATDGALTLKVDGDISGDKNLDPRLSFDFRDNPMPGTTRIDFDLYMETATATDTGADGATYNKITDYRVQINPALSTGSNFDYPIFFQFKQSDNTIRTTDKNVSTETEYAFGVWHKVSIIYEIADGAAALTYIVDGDVIESEVDSGKTDIVGVPGMRIQLSGLTKNTQINAKVALDNVKVYTVENASEANAITLPASDYYTLDTDNLNIMTLNGATVADLKAEMVEYDVAVTKNNVTLQNTDPLLGGEQVKVTNAEKGVSECYYVTNPDYEAFCDDVDAISLASTVTGNFEIWDNASDIKMADCESDNTAAITVAKDENNIWQATVIRGEYDEEVTLTAVFTDTDEIYSVEKTFDFTVKAIKPITVEPVADPIIVDGEITVDVADLTSKEDITNVIFVATIVDGSGNVKASGYNIIDSADFEEGYTTLTINAFEDASGNPYALTDGDAIGEWYLWDNNNVSLRNNTPTDVANLKATSKMRAIDLKWDACYDDWSDTVAYEIYRTEVETGEEKYLDTIYGTNYTDMVEVNLTPANNTKIGAQIIEESEHNSFKENTQYEYRIIPVDINELSGTEGVIEEKSKQPIYIDFTIDPDSGETYHNGMTVSNTETPYNSENRVVEGVGRCQVADYVADKDERHRIMLAVDKAVASQNLGYSEENPPKYTDGVVIEVEYYDDGGKDLMVLRSVGDPAGDEDIVVTLEGEEVGWKTVVFEKTGMAMDNSFTRNTSMGFRPSGKNTLYIKSIRWVPSELYGLDLGN